MILHLPYIILHENITSCVEINHVFSCALVSHDSNRNGRLKMRALGLFDQVFEFLYLIHMCVQNRSVNTKCFILEAVKKAWRRETYRGKCPSM